ncbi:MAG: hypothetical protein AAB551_03305 [Patescibacteria group bacterium]
MLRHTQKSTFSLFPARLARRDTNKFPDLENSDFSDEAMEKVKKGEKAQDAIDSEKAIGQKLVDIHKMLEGATELSSKEREELQRRVIELGRNKNSEEVKKFEEKVAGTIKDTQETTRAYFAKLEGNSELFDSIKGKNGPAPLDQKKKEFVQQTLEGKKERLQKINEEIAEIREMRDRLVKTVGASPKHLEAFGSKETKEKQGSYIESLEKNIQEFEDQFSEGVKNKIYEKEAKDGELQRFRDASVEDQKKILDRMKEETSKRNAKESFAGNKKTYNEFSSERRSAFESQWEKAKTEKEQKEILVKMREDLRKDVLKKWTQSDKSKFYSRKEKENINNALEKSDFSVKNAEQWAKEFDEWVKVPEGYAKTYEGSPALVQALYKDFWDLTVDKKEKVANEVKEHTKMIEEWDKMLTKAEKEQMICHTSSEDYKKRFVGVKLEDKIKIVKGQNTLKDPRRAQSLHAFKNLPKEIQKENETTFYNSRLEKRLGMLKEIKEDMKEQAKLRGELHNKVKDKLKKNVIAPKSAKEYHKWIDNDLKDTKELKKMADHSDLDNPQREHVLDKFEELDPKIQEKNKKEFYDADLSGRILLLKKIMPDKGEVLDKELSSLEKAGTEVKNLHEKMGTVQLKEIAERFEKNKNLEAEEDIRKMIKEKNPDDKDNNERLKQIELLLGESPDAVAAIQDAEEDATMAIDLDALRIQNTYAKIISLDERRQKDKRGLKARNKEGHRDENVARLAGQLFEETDGEMILDRNTGEAVDVQNLEMTQHKKHDKSTMEQQKRFFKEKEKAKFATGNERDARSRAYTMTDEKGEELSGEKLEHRQENDNIRMAQKIVDRVLIKNPKMDEKAQKDLIKSIVDELEEDTLVKIAA